MIATSSKHAKICLGLLQSCASEHKEAHRIVSFLPTCDIRLLAATDTFFLSTCVTVTSYMKLSSDRFTEKNDDPQLLCWSIAMKPSHCYSETYVLENQVRVLRLCGGNLIDIYKAIGKDMQDGAPFEEQSSTCAPLVVQRWIKNKRAAIQTEWRHTHGSFPDMSSNWTALHWAVYRGDVQIIRSLVHLSGVDVEVKDKEGKNRLHSYHQPNNFVDNIFLL